MATVTRASSDGSRTRSADLRLEVSCAPEAVEAVAELLREQGAPGVAIDGLTWAVDGDDVRPLPQRSGPARVFSVVPGQGAAEMLRAVEEALARRVAPFFGAAQASLAELPTEDWVAHYRRSVTPVLVAPGLVVAPPWAEASDAARGGERILWIEPGAAFGTGDHASTRTTLRAGLSALRAGDDVIDLGCGTGILGAAALLFGAGRLRAYDLDPMAVQATRETLRRNALGAHVRKGPLPRRARPADLLFANLSGTVLRPLLGQLRGAVRAGGHAALGGVLREDPGFLDDCRAAGFRVERTEVEGDFQAILCRRP